MPKFRYLAIDNGGNYRRGILEAPSMPLAAAELKDNGLWVIDVFNQGSSILYREIHFGGPRVKTEHFTAFCRQLSTLYKAGVQMVEAVKVLGEQSESKVLRRILLEIEREMQSGTQLSQAAAQYPTVFSSIFVNMIRAGEAGGNLDEMLERVAVYHEKEYYTRGKVKSALIYPGVMAVVTVLVVMIMVKFVIPQFVGNFQAMGVELPLATRIVIYISDFMKQYWYVVIFALFVPYLLIMLVKRLPNGPYYLDYIKLKIPVFGTLWHKQSIARFSRTFSSLFAAAIPMLEMLEIVSTVVGNEVIKRQILKSREGVRTGRLIAEPLRGSRLFPPMVVQMLAIGERTGALDSMLGKVADFYEADVDQMTDRLKTLLEPLMILILSGVVGGIVMAVMLPTYKILGNLH